MAHDNIKQYAAEGRAAGRAAARHDYAEGFRMTDSWRGEGQERVYQVAFAEAERATEDIGGAFAKEACNHYAEAFVSAYRDNLDRLTSGAPDADDDPDQRAADDSDEEDDSDEVITTADRLELMRAYSGFHTLYKELQSVYDQAIAEENRAGRHRPVQELGTPAGRLEYLLDKMDAAINRMGQALHIDE